MKSNNNAKEEDNNIDRLSSHFNHTQTANTLIIANAKTINTANAKDNKVSNIALMVRYYTN